MKYTHVPLNMRLKKMELQYFIECSKKIKVIQDPELTGNHTSGRKCNISFQKKSFINVLSDKWTFWYKA